MEHKNRILLFFLLLFSLQATVKAQHLPVDNQYFVNPYALSPAMAGYDQKARVFLGYREQWTAMPASPVSAMANIVFPLNERVWLGANVMSHESSIFKNIFARLSYTYSLPLAEEQTLAFGMSAGILQNSINLEEITINDLNDPLLSGSDMLSGLSLHADASLAYFYRDFILGLSAPGLLNINNDYSLDASENTLNKGTEFLLFSMYNWLFHEKWQFKPAFVFRYAENTPFSMDLLGMLEYEGKYRLGLYYRTESIVGISLGGYITEKINLNYSWAFENNGYTPYTAGTHEFTLGYELGGATKKTKRKKSKGDKYPDVILYDKKYRR